VQLARQAPAHTQVTVVVDDLAEDVPALLVWHACIVAARPPSAGEVACR